MAGIGIGLGIGLGGDGGGWSEASIARAIASRGISDAAARASVGAAGTLAAGLRGIGLLPPVALPPPPATTAYPAGLAAMWDAASLASLADGAAVASWTDGVGGIALAQASAGGRPTFVADAGGIGKPGVCFNGSQLLTASRTGAAASLAALIDSQVHTTYIVATGIGASGLGCPFSASAGGDSYLAVADGTQLGRFDGGSGQLVPHTGTGAVAFGFSSTTDPSGGAGSGLQRTYVNGGCVAAAVSPVPKTGADFAAGAVAGGALGFVGTILSIFIFDRALTPVEMIQLEKAWRDRAGIAYPWAGGEFLVMLGDSQTMGVGTDNGQAHADNRWTYPYQLAQRRGLAYGQWSNLGIGGIAVDLPSQPPAGPQMQGRLSTDVYGTAAQIGFAPKYVVGEWYNMHLANLPGATEGGYMSTYIASLKAESPSSKVALWTSFAYNGETAASPDVQRAAYNGYWDTASNRTGKVDAYFPVHADAHLGTAGAVTSTYFSDGIHLTGVAGYPATPSGYPYFADTLQQALEGADF